MDEHLQNLEMLCVRHPSFKLHPLSITCGPGWFPLIDAALQELERLQKLAPHLQFNVLQATEKFGALRLYISVPNGTRADVEAVGALIRRAEQRSKKVCRALWSTGDGKGAGRVVEHTVHSMLRES